MRLRPVCPCEQHHRNQASPEANPSPVPLTFPLRRQDVAVKRLTLHLFPPLLLYVNMSRASNSMLQIVYYIVLVLSRTLSTKVEYYKKAKCWRGPTLPGPCGPSTIG